MYSHTRRAAHILRLMTAPSPEDDVLSRPAKKQQRHPQSQHCAKHKQEVLTSRIHSKRHGVEESRRLVAATHCHQNLLLN